ncbi:MAG: S8 family serine peptidase [Chloroflexota bacterium]
MPLFTSNIPHHDSYQRAVLTTPERVGAPPEYSGRGVTIAVVDSGFYMHADLNGRVLVHADATTNHINEQPQVMEASEQSWHGQMTSVIAAGDGFSSGGRYRGIASQSELVLVKISSPRGQVKERDILRGLRWIIDTHRRFNVRVVNLSVGGDDYSADPEHPIHVAVRHLTEAGIVVVAAAGNYGRDWVVPPASAPEAMVVGGYDDHNTTDRSQWTGYHSSWGSAFDGSSKPDIVAPAAWIASPILPGSLVDREAFWLGPLLESESERALKRLLTRGYGDLGLPREQAKHPSNSLYEMLQARINSHKLIDAKHQHVDGTSVSAAIVSAVVAQMIEANPRLTPAQIRAILIDTAHPLNAVPRAQQGAGAIDPARAVRACEFRPEDNA